jgi:hypothetical protein
VKHQLLKKEQQRKRSRPSIRTDDKLKMIKMIENDKTQFRGSRKGK